MRSQSSIRLVPTRHTLLFQSPLPVNAGPCRRLLKTTYFLVDRSCTGLHETARNPLSPSTSQDASVTVRHARSTTAALAGSREARQRGLAELLERHPPVRRSELTPTLAEELFGVWSWADVGKPLTIVKTDLLRVAEGMSGRAPPKQGLRASNRTWHSQRVLQLRR